MKIQSQPRAAVLQDANTFSAEVAAKPTGAGFVPGSAGPLPARFQDGFEQRPVDPNQPGIVDRITPPYPFPVSDSLSIKDRIASLRLAPELSSPLNKARLEAGQKDVVLSRDITGTMRGPEGQPLARVWLNAGTTAGSSAYVDPNTNRYYLTDELETSGRTNAMGPLDLPAGLAFSNSYFTDPEVQSIERLSQTWAWPFPWPSEDLPPPPQDPVPTNTGPIVNLDSSVLLAADAGKASGLE